MQREFVTLGAGEWPVLYRMMVQQKFPDVPPAYEEAKPYFEGAHVFGVRNGSDLLAGLVLGKDEDGVSFLDVVCAPAQHGKWASRHVVAELCRAAFTGMGLRCVWIQVRNKAALKSALQAGFVPATPLDCEAPVLALTPNLASRWLNEKETRHG